MPRVPVPSLLAIGFCYRRITGVLVAGVLAMLAIVSYVHAEPSVLLVVKGAADQDTAPYELRLRSEFASEGLEVVTASGRSQQNLLDLEGLARRTGALAALSVYIDVQEVQGRLWVSDPNSAVDLVRTLSVQRGEGDPVTIFALRAVEALRGARIELEQQRRRANTAAAPSETSSAPGDATAGSKSAEPSAGSVPVRPHPQPEPAKVSSEPHATNLDPNQSRAWRRWTVLVGAAAGFDQNGLGAIGAPLLVGRYQVLERLSLGAAFAGPFLSRQSNSAGTAQVDQELIDLQLRYRAINVGRTQVEGIITTGPSRFAVTGKDTREPETADSAVSLGWTFGLGLGSQLLLTEHWLLGLDVQWARRLPAPWVRVGQGHITGQTDSLILAKLGMGVVF